MPLQRRGKPASRRIISPDFPAHPIFEDYFESVNILKERRLSERSLALRAKKGKKPVEAKKQEKEAIVTELQLCETHLEFLQKLLKRPRLWEEAGFKGVEEIRKSMVSGKTRIVSRR